MLHNDPYLIISNDRNESIMIYWNDSIAIDKWGTRMNRQIFSKDNINKSNTDSQKVYLGNKNWQAAAVKRFLNFKDNWKCQIFLCKNNDIISWQLNLLPHQFIICQKVPSLAVYLATFQGYVSLRESSMGHWYGFFTKTTHWKRALPT